MKTFSNKIGADLSEFAENPIKTNREGKTLALIGMAKICLNAGEPITTMLGGKVVTIKNEKELEKFLKDKEQLYAKN